MPCTLLYTQALPRCIKGEKERWAYKVMCHSCVILNIIYTNTKYILLYIKDFWNNTQEIDDNSCLSEKKMRVVGWYFTVFSFVIFFCPVHVTFPIEKKIPFLSKDKPRDCWGKGPWLLFLGYLFSHTAGPARSPHVVSWPSSAHVASIYLCAVQIF